MAPETMPILGLQMKSEFSFNAAGKFQYASLVLEDQVHVMMSQDRTLYKCNDYLGRRSKKSSLQAMQLEASRPRRDEGDTSMLTDLEIVDAVCREKMCEWSYRVCDHFRVQRIVVALAFSCLDRFVDRCNCDRTSFKLAAITCLYIASKVSATRRITLQRLADLSRGEFEQHHIVEMETIILQTVGWRLSSPTTQCFLGVFSQVLQSCIHGSRIAYNTLQRALFFAELSLFDYTFVPKQKSLIAVAAILNAIEGLEESIGSPSGERQSRVLECLDKSIGLKFEEEHLDKVRNRLWYVYSMSAQFQDDEVALVRDTSPLPLEQKESKCEDTRRSRMGYSPVCVTST